MTKKGTVFIADPHLGDRRWESEHIDEFHDFLDNFVAPYAERLIIAGDLFELCQMGWPGSLKRCTESLARLLALPTQGVQIIVVAGNHDIDLSLIALDSPGIKIEYPKLHLEIDGYSFHVEHGHFYQPEYQKSPAVYNYLAAWGGVLDRLDPELEDKLGEFKKRIGKIIPTSRKSDKHLAKDMNVFAKAGLTLGAGKHDYVLFGHTHNAEIVQFEEKGIRKPVTYVNLGDWIVHSDFGYFAKGQFTLLSWPKDREQALGLVAQRVS